MKKTLAILLALCMVVGIVACKTQQPADTEKPVSDATDAPSASTPDDEQPNPEPSEIDLAVARVLDEKVPVSISYWTGLGTDNYTIVENMLAAFMAKYPNITVELSNQGPTQELTDKLTQNIVAGTTPCLSHVQSATFLEYVSSEALVDLAPYYNHERIGFTEEQKNSFYPQYINQLSSYGPEGTMYGFPTNMKSTDVLIYNKTVLDSCNLKAPTTWDEVAEYSKLLYDETGVPGMSFDCGAYPEAQFKTLSQQWGSPFIVAEGELDINNAASKAALEFYKTNLDAGYFTLAQFMPSASGNYGSNGFLMQECYMAINAAAGVTYCMPKEAAGHVMFELGVAPLPQKDLNDQYALFKGVDYCVFANTTEEQRVATWLLIKFLSEDENNLEWYIGSAYQPITSTMQNVPEYKAFLETPNDGSALYYKAASVNAVLQMSEALTPDIIVTNLADIYSECGVLWQSVMIGGADIDTALEQMENNLQ